jgi:hypothetical protein
MIFTEWDWDVAREVWEERAMEKGIGLGGEEVLALLKKGMSVEEAEKTFYEKHSFQRSKT